VTLTQISNLFNSIALASGLFKFYHYGWPQDMNINIQNNSDPNASLGSQFPYLLFMPPVISNTVLDSSNYQTYQVELLLTDTYGFNAQHLDYKGDTTLDVESKLCEIAKQFVDYLRQYGEKVNFDVNTFSFDIDPMRFVQNTRSVRVRFSLNFTAVCPDGTLDLSFLPDNLDDIDEIDLENLNP
jgi:hypothetical protein